MFLISRIWLLVSLWMRPLYKWIMRRIFGLCELQRICYGAPAGATRCLGVEKSLRLSQMTLIRELVQLLDNVAARASFHGDGRECLVSGAVDLVIRVKKIKPAIHPRFAPALTFCIDTIWQYRHMTVELQMRRKIAYTSTKPEHETKLTHLWRLLMPETELNSRISNQWKEIGFQGDDPATDFRGMGILSLECLIYMASRYVDIARHLLSHSHHPRYGYSFAIVGINLCQLAFQLVNDGIARPHFYNAKHRLTNKNHSQGDCDDVIAIDDVIADFAEFYVGVFHSFDALWLSSRPRDIMEFGRVRKLFEEQLRAALQLPTARLDPRQLVNKV